MSNYSAPIRDMRFVMEEWLDAPACWRTWPKLASLDVDAVSMILEQGNRFVSSYLLTCRASGDVEGCTLQGGSVKTPAGFRQAYRAFCEGGWPGLACSLDDGGQGLPLILNLAFFEMLAGANHAWTMYVGLIHGAAACLRRHASEVVQQAYLPQIVSGNWLPTMCLTEPQAGSDLGLIRTVAEPMESDFYAITGSKIFVSGGEQDLSENIVHLLLARLPGAPAGTRGLSLFLVPKYLQVRDQFVSNRVYCDGIERKMGIKGSATCITRFDGAQAWLIGAKHGGLSAMFTMMNAARLHVASQGLGHAEFAHQNALNYARERRQSRAPGDGRSPHADPIVRHPCIRRILMDQRAVIEGERVVAYWLANLLDLVEHHPSAEERARADSLASLLTPIAKAFFTENGFKIASSAMQVYGGHGFLHDSGLEQTLRDSRVAMLYEGTNEIQAVDLLVRKIGGEHGPALALLLRLVEDEAGRHVADSPCAREARTVQGACEALRRITDDLLEQREQCNELLHRAADDYLRAFGLFLLAFAWLRTKRIALASAGQSDHFYDAKVQTANYFFAYSFLEFDYRLQLIRSAHADLPQLV